MNFQAVEIQVNYNLYPTTAPHAYQHKTLLLIHWLPLILLFYFIIIHDTLFLIKLILKLLILCFLAHFPCLCFIWTAYKLGFERN